MMKLLLFIAFFFVLHGQSFASLSESDKKEVVDLLNELRGSVAKVGNFANMHEIKYDASIEKNIATCEEAQKAAVDDNRLIDLDMERATKSKATVDKKLVENLLTGSDAGGVRRIIHPLHDGIGCTLFKESCNIWTRVSKEDTANKNAGSRPEPSEERSKRYSGKGRYLCFFGHEANVKPMTGMKRGEAGSQCPNGKSESNQYLCKGSKSILSHSAILGFILTIVLSASF